MREKLNIFVKVMGGAIEHAREGQSCMVYVLSPSIRHGLVAMKLFHGCH